MPAASGKPVPTIAELLVLKGMQADINVRTERLHRSLDVQDPTERQLRRLRTIGDDQNEVRRLTDLVTQRAREH